MADPLSVTPPSLDELRERHRPVEKMDYVAIPPETYIGCESCEFVQWPCDAGRLLEIIDALPPDSTQRRA